jgi:hypothetical protein
MDKPRSKRITRKTLNEIPIIAMAPIPVRIPLMSIMYHSGYFTSTVIRMTAAVIDKPNDHVSEITVASKG